MCILLSSATVAFLISFTLSHTHTYAYTNYIQFPFVMLPRRLQTKWRRIRARIFLGFYLKWSSLNTSYHIYSALSLIWSEGISFVRAATNDDTNGKYKHVEPDKLIFIIVSIAFNLFVVIRCILEKLLQVVALRIIEMFSRLPESTQLSCSVWLPRRKSWINRRNETFPARISARFMQLIGYFFGIYSISVTLTSVHLFFNKLVDCIFQWNS